MTIQTPGTAELALFPLPLVLFPGGQMELRIFEPRYLDLVRDCTREDRGFGITLLIEDNESGKQPMPAGVGTEARIVDFFSRDDGLLGIRVEGRRRYRIESAHARADHLLIGEAYWYPPDPVLSLPAEYVLLASILERIHEHVGGEIGSVERERYDDASWVGFRLAEAFPLVNAERQLLLQIDDPLQRLDQLMHYLPRFQRD
ncbi:MAG: LON peptidase substrate-binding domain-containing protein [Dokdonella sp.]